MAEQTTGYLLKSLGGSGERQDLLGDFFCHNKGRSSIIFVCGGKSNRMCPWCQMVILFLLKVIPLAVMIEEVVFPCVSLATQATEMVFLLVVYRLYVPLKVVLSEGLAAVGAALGGPRATRSLTGGGLVTTCSHTTQVSNILNLFTSLPL